MKINFRQFFKPLSLLFFFFFFFSVQSTYGQRKYTGPAKRANTNKAAVSKAYCQSCWAVRGWSQSGEGLNNVPKLKKVACDFKLSGSGKVWLQTDGNGGKGYFLLIATSDRYMTKKGNTYYFEPLLTVSSEASGSKPPKIITNAVSSTNFKNEIQASTKSPCN